MSILELFSLSGKTIVVTGAGSGLGKAIAEACGGAGGAIVCASRTQAAADTAAAISQNGGQAVSVSADVTSEAAVHALMETAAREFGSVDVVFCNAGTSDHYKRADQTSLEEWQHVIGVNLTSVFLCAKHAVPRMIAQGRGKIITVASIWGQVASDTVPVPSYVAAKGGVVSLTRELAMEYLPFGISVNCLSPGFFATAIGTDKSVEGDVIDQLVAGALRRTPIHRIMEPREIQGAAVFLASEASNAVNAHILTVDGGLVAC